MPEREHTREDLVRWLRPDRFVLESESDDIDHAIDLYIALLDRFSPGRAAGADALDLVFFRAMCAELWRMRRIDDDRVEQEEICESTEDLYIERYENLLLAAAERGRVRRERIAGAKEILDAAKDIRLGLFDVVLKREAQR